MFSCAPYLLIVVCLAFFRAGSENLPTCVFQVRFSPRKHGIRGNECQKGSVVSVWYAQNSLPFCTEVWYTTLASCEDPAKMLMRVCTLLLMQPAPLTGTATYRIPNHDTPAREMQPAPLTGTATMRETLARHGLTADAARTPHGDSNRISEMAFIDLADAARTPHGDSNGYDVLDVGLLADAARTPHGDSNIRFPPFPQATCRCSPHPSRGQKRRRHTRFCVTPSFLLSRGGLKPL